MKASKLPLQTLRLKNFKAVRDSGLLRFTQLTVFIGNNGSGKSSILEALEALQTIVVNGIDEAMRPWRGFEHIWNKAVGHESEEDQAGFQSLANPMVFEFSGNGYEMPVVLTLNTTKERNLVSYRFDSPPYPKTLANVEQDLAIMKAEDASGEPGIRNPRLRSFVSDWQFLSLAPQSMLYPLPQTRSLPRIRLAKDGSNVAEFLLSLRDRDVKAFEGLLETLRTVLPYATDITPAITSELERNVYLRMKERGIEGFLPGWLLSQGTLRLAAFLAVFRYPKPASVVFIEELENGLDPRAIHLIVEEIRLFIASGGQVVVTTHSPFLLDLCDLSQIVVVERKPSGVPEFRRPSKRNLGDWAKEFTAGRLYTMGSLTKG